MKPLTLGLLILGSVLLLTVGCSAIAQSNQEVDLRTQYEQKFEERTAFFDNMYKTLDQKTQIAVRNDSSFQNIVITIMENRRTAEGQFMTWVQEQNPGVQFTEVTRLYEDLSRAVEAKRDQFFEQEKYLQDIKREHDNILRKFPSTILMTMLGREPLPYKPITSDRTDEVIRTGKDNDTEIFD